MNDAAYLALAVGLLCLVFAGLGAVADWWESPERRDAARRNGR